MKLRHKMDSPQKRWLHFNYNRLWSRTKTKTVRICSWSMKFHLKRRRESLKMLRSLESWECHTSTPTKVTTQHILTEVKRKWLMNKLSTSRTISSKLKFRVLNKMVMVSQLSNWWSSFRMRINCRQLNSNSWTSYLNKNGRKILSHKRSSSITIFTQFWQRMLRKQNNVSLIWIQTTNQKKLARRMRRLSNASSSKRKNTRPCLNIKIM